MPSTTLRALKEVSLADQAYEMLRTAILEGQMKPNERFTIEEIAERLSISRTPVREALKALQSDGLVRLLPHRGAMVEPYALGEVRNRYVIAAMLEGYAAELVCKGDHAEVAEKLLANCEELRKACEQVDEKDADQLRRLVALNREFHQLIREASGSATLVRLLESLRQPTSYAMHYWGEAKWRFAALEIHERIAKAIAAGDAARACKLAEQHLMDACERIVGSQSVLRDASMEDLAQEGSAASGIKQPRRATNRPSA